MSKYEGRFKALEKKIPRDMGGDFITYHLEKDDTFLGPDDERLTWEELDALDCNMIVVGWQKHWTQEETEALGINARRHNLQDWLKGYDGKTDEASLEMAAKIEAMIQEEEDELKRKGLPIEEERDNRPLAGCLVFKGKGKGWLQGES